MKLLGVPILIMVFSFTCTAQSNENTAVPFTLADRDRIMRTEQKLEALQKSIDQRFESLRNELNSRFEGIDTKFEGIDTKFEGIDTKFEGIDTKFEGIDTKFEGIDIKFDAIYVKFDAINEKFEAQQKQLDNIYVLLFFILGSVMSLIGFVIYDRRTAIKPVQREQENMLQALREYAKNHSDLAEILKKAGIL